MELPNDVKNLFLMWLEDDLSKFTLRQHRSGMIYSKAINSLQEYEGQIKSPEELKKVPFVGTKLTELLTKRLQNYCDANGYIFPFLVQSKTTKKRNATDDNNDGTGKKRTKKAYVPKKSSGGYAILLALLEFDKGQLGISKDVIVTNAGQYCSTSFQSNPGANELYSAWSSMKTLLNNELVKQQGRPTKYFLTDEGKKLAETLKAAENIRFRNESNISPTRQASYHAKTVRIPTDRVIRHFENTKYFCWEPDSFDIVLIVDNREIRAKDQRDYFEVKLRQFNVNVETRALVVGDALWIARNRKTNEEVVLDYIVERKRLDDLASSIKDGRYNEQKTRLKRSAIENVFYVVEEVTSSEIQNMADAIQTSMSMAITNSNFHCKRTKDADETIQFLVRTTKELTKHYEDKTILVLDPHNLEYQEDYKNILNRFRCKFGTSNVKCAHLYNTFDTMLSKSNLMTVREMFVRALMTIRGISLEKAIAIQKEYKTPRKLIETFDATDPTIAKKYGKKVQKLIGQTFQSREF